MLCIACALLILLPDHYSIGYFALADFAEPSRSLSESEAKFLEGFVKFRFSLVDYVVYCFYRFLCFLLCRGCTEFPELA